CSLCVCVSVCVCVCVSWCLCVLQLLTGGHTSDTHRPQYDHTHIQTHSHTQSHTVTQTHTVTPTLTTTRTHARTHTDTHTVSFSPAVICSALPKSEIKCCLRVARGNYISLCKWPFFQRAV